jgi:hypothetical protein
MTVKVLNLFTHILSRVITMAYPNDQQGKALPFFARFLSVSKEESSIKSPGSPSWTQTLKYPSDWEEF